MVRKYTKLTGQQTGSNSKKLTSVVVVCLVLLLLIIYSLTIYILYWPVTSTIHTQISTNTVHTTEKKVSTTAVTSVYSTFKNNYYPTTTPTAVHYFDATMLNNGSLSLDDIVFGQIKEDVFFIELPVLWVWGSSRKLFFNREITLYGITLFNERIILLRSKLFRNFGHFNLHASRDLYCRFAVEVRLTLPDGTSRILFDTSANSTHFPCLVAPDPPTDLHLVSVTPHSIQVAWSAPETSFCNFAPTHYKVSVDKNSYKPARTSIEAIVVPAETLNATLSYGVLPNHHYLVRVQSECEQLRSKPIKSYSIFLNVKTTN
jgi:hypothetical protein